jgi:GNAT superfamily N-acetyltransferase
VANLKYYKLGNNPEYEAARTQRLYFDSGVDVQVRDEFEDTVNVYTSLSLTEIAQRLRIRYAGDRPVAHGVLPSLENNDIGMAVWGEKDFQDVHTSQEIPGINVSAWLLRQYRNKGFGRQLLEYATTEAVVLSNDLGKQVWTSIKPDNIASRRSCEHAGFIEIGPHTDKPERLLYIYQAK